MTKLLRNVCANWLGLAVNMVVAFLMSPFLVHSLGDTMYGLWVLLLAVTGYMGLLDAGLKVAVVKFISRAHAVGDRTEMSRVVTTVLALHGTIGIIIVLLAIVASPFVPYLFQLSPETVPIARIVLIITGLNLAMTLTMSVFNGVLAGIQRYDAANLIGISVTLARSAAAVMVISSGYGIIALGLVQTAAQLASGLLLMRAAFRNVEGLHLRWSLVNMPTVRRLYGFGSFVLLNNLAMFSLFNSAEILIGTFLGAAAVTYYAIAGSLLQYLSQLIGQMTQVLHPYAAAQDAKGEAAGLRRTIVLGTKACLIIALPAGVTFMLIGKAFITFWMGARYAEVAGPLVVVLTIGRLFWLSQSSSGNVLLGAGKHRILTVANLTTGVLGLILGSILIQRMGLLGLALGMTIPMVVMQGLVLPYLTVKAFGIRVSELVWQGYLQPLFGTLPYAATLAVLLRLVNPSNLFELAITILLALPILVAGMWLLAISGDQRRMVLRACSKWLPAPMAQTVR